MRLSVSRRLDAIEAGVRQLMPPREAPLLQRLRDDPARVLSEAGFAPDDWQAEVLRSRSLQVLMLCARQCGKSTTASALALREALLQPGAIVLLLSPSLRQSGELFRSKMLPLWRRMGSPLQVKAPTRLELELGNGSRIVSLPDSEGTIRGFSSVAALVIDEASRVSDGLAAAVRPMLAVSRGRLIALSTPFGQLGWFYESWHGAEDWHRVEVKASDCPRISKEFLAGERRALGAKYYAMEYENAFLGLAGAVFDPDDVEKILGDDLAPVLLR